MLLLRQNTKANIAKIAEHIGVVLSDKMLDDITNAVQFSSLAKGKYESEGMHREAIAKDFTIYRKGTTITLPNNQC